MLTLECRGADSNQPDEFNRQRTKLLAALAGLDGDVIGLNEIENTTGVDPLGDPAKGIVAGLNAMPGIGPYAAIDTGRSAPTRSRSGSSTGRASSGRWRVPPPHDRGRPALHRHEEPARPRPDVRGARHRRPLHGRGEPPQVQGLRLPPGRPGHGDGQGNCNQTRKAAAQALVDWLATDPTGSDDPDFLIMGDLNAYAKEDPIDAVRAGADDTLGTGDDYTNLVERFEGAVRVLVRLRRQAGVPRPRARQSAVVHQVLGASEWHINADEPDLLDYDTSFKSRDPGLVLRAEPVPLGRPRPARRDPLRDLTACAIDRLREVAETLEELMASGEQEGKRQARGRSRQGGKRAAEARAGGRIAREQRVTSKAPPETSRPRSSRRDRDRDRAMPCSRRSRRPSGSSRSTRSRRRRPAAASRQDRRGRAAPRPWRCPARGGALQGRGRGVQGRALEGGGRLTERVYLRRGGQRGLRTEAGSCERACGAGALQRLSGVAFLEQGDEQACV